MWIDGNNPDIDLSNVKPKHFIQILVDKEREL